MNSTREGSRKYPQIKVHRRKKNKKKKITTRNLNQKPKAYRQLDCTSEIYVI